MRHLTQNAGSMTRSNAACGMDYAPMFARLFQAPGLGGISLALLSGAPAAFAQVQPPATAASAPEPAAQRVDVTGARPGDTQERRQSTAAKIIIGRDEIERFGDSSLGELLKRLPGVTTGGTPGRGGAIRMRGLGGGYTQILLDGERVQGGLSLDSIDPDMVERIEILRAPTAETGARAIAGTINVITREGFRKRLNDLKLSLALENGIVLPGSSWTRDDKWNDLSYSLTLNAWGWRRKDDSVTTTTSSDARWVESTDSASRRHGLNANARLQWPLGEGSSLMLMPLLVYSEGGGSSRTEADFPPSTPPGLQPYDRAVGVNDSRFLLARLNGQWRHRLGEGRMEWRGGVATSQSASSALRRQYDGDKALPPLDESTDSRERNGHLNGKYTLLLGESNNLVAGAEIDVARRAEDGRSTLLDPEGSGPLLDPTTGQAVLDNQDKLTASTQRLALYAQDEWTLTPQWAAHAGVRWEGITTEGEGDGEAAAQRNRSSVWTPLLHAVWKPEPSSRDQVRISLTRSYRSPTLQNLLGRYNVSSRFPEGDNLPSSPDRAGNPALRPELATGIDLAIEHYLPASGLFSANLFHRRVTDLMRTLTTLEEMPGSGQRRWVARPQNVGDATTQGIELEAKFRLSELVVNAPAVDLRANLSVFRSKVDSVPAPDNRLDQQPGGTANFGADYRWPGLPLTLGGNVNITPGYTTRLSDTQWAVQSGKRIVDAYVLWTINPSARLRVTASNLLHEDNESASVFAGGLSGTADDERADTVGSSFVNWRVQLELKL
jgi:outer membrane receptor for ferrienterochelin and colicins